MNTLGKLVALVIFMILLAIGFIKGLEKEDERPIQGLTMVEKETIHREEVTARFEAAVARGDDIPELFPEKK